MPRQETFLSIKNGDETVEVLKTYDQTFARDAFRNMDEIALAHLASSLKPESLYEENDIPKPGDESYQDFIWDVMVDDAREDWKTFSYFVVIKSSSRKTEELFVSGDWPTTEAYVKLMGLAEGAVSPSREFYSLLLALAIHSAAAFCHILAGNIGCPVPAANR